MDKSFKKVEKKYNTRKPIERYMLRPVNERVLYISAACQRFLGNTFDVYVSPTHLALTQGNTFKVTKADTVTLPREIVKTLGSGKIFGELQEDKYIVFPRTNEEE